MQEQIHEQQRKMQKIHLIPITHRLLSVPITVLAIMGVFIFHIPNPMMVLIIPVVLFTYLDGYVSGTLSGITAVAYSVHFFYVSTSDTAAAGKLATIILAVSTIILLVGKLHAQDKRIIARLRQMNRELVEAKERAEELSKAKSEFLSRMSHEIRTPMNAVIGLTSIALKSKDDEKNREYLGKINDASMHLLGVINDILDMSKIEAGKVELSLSDFALENMLKQVVSVNQFRFEQKKLNFSIYVDSRVPTAIVTDQQRLAQVITNLLSNAAKFTPDGKNVSLSIHLQDETEDIATIRFAVKDEGIGMTEAQMSQLFQAFEQADSSISSRFGGTGLGLAISKAIVEMMGGTIWVDSVPDEGSCFAFDIVVEKGESIRDCYLNPNVDSAKTHLLVVDDCESVLAYFKAITQSSGMHCDAVRTVEEAMKRFEENVYQIVFLDGKLLGAEGGGRIRDMIQRIDGEQPIVAMYAGDQSEIEDEAKALGIKHIIAKPLLPSPIIDCINECLVGAYTKKTDNQPTDGADDNKDIFKGLRMLLVDDIEVNREILKAIVESSGIDVDEATNGLEACEMFAQQPDAYDIIVMDIHMPEMDGYAATCKIREMTDIEAASTVPILAMTANVFRESVEKCLQCGMNDHVGKPVDEEELLYKMKRLLRAKVYG